MRRDLPAGTVTFLFTDVEGSTKLLDELGAEQYAAALAEHRRIVRESCAEQGGAEVDTQGDAFFFAFPTAPGALEASRAIVEGLSSGRVQVRIGVHTGTPLLTEEGYVGADVHRAARIAASGHGGQVLVSAATTALISPSGSEPQALPLRDLGEHRFKDLAAAERVFQLGEDSFPPLKSLYRTNLPVPTTAMVGRERELAEIVELLDREDMRVLTLSGPGGTGKTRLAHPGGCRGIRGLPRRRLVGDARSAPRPAPFASSLAAALRVDEQPGRELAESVAERLDGRRALLLLDNAEHLLPAVASEIARLRDVVGPTILVTSRERLQLQGEHVYAVPTLDDADGVALFVTRALALDSTAKFSQSVTELCARLDNLPLALELAAARTVVFTPEQLLERLAQRLDLLKAGRDADPRQQTLRATIEWSYDLFDDTERKLFRALSVCAGGCTYESAEAICSAEPDTLQSLLDKSLLRRREAELGPRYWMLETIRELAAEKLDSEDETGAARRLHAEHYLALARSTNLNAEASGQQRHDVAISERDNMRAALAWALESGERELGIELLVALENFWATSGPQEGSEMAAALLADDTPIPERVLIRGLRVHGGMVNMLGDIDLAIQRWEQALEIARTLGDDKAVAILLHRLSDMARLRGDLPRARALASESLAGHHRSEFGKGETQALTSLAEITRAEGDPDGALALLQESPAHLPKRSASAGGSRAYWRGSAPCRSNSVGSRTQEPTQDRRWRIRGRCKIEKPSSTSSASLRRSPPSRGTGGTRASSGARRKSRTSGRPPAAGSMARSSRSACSPTPTRPSSRAGPSAASFHSRTR